MAAFVAFAAAGIYASSACAAEGELSPVELKAAYEAVIQELSAQRDFAQARLASMAAQNAARRCDK
jgi:hypothetical protein